MSNTKKGTLKVQTQSKTPTLTNSCRALHEGEPSVTSARVPANCVGTRGVGTGVGPSGALVFIWYRRGQNTVIDFKTP